MDEISIESKSKQEISQEQVDEISIEGKKRQELSEESVDEISVSDENKKPAKPSLDKLDVQGPGLKLLGQPKASRLGNQDVLKDQGNKPKQKGMQYIKSDKFPIKSDSKNIYSRTQQKGGNIHSSSSIISKDKYKKDVKNKSISSNVIADKNVKKRSDDNLKYKDKYSKGKLLISKEGKPETDNVSVSLSHHSQIDIVDIKHKEPTSDNLSNYSQKNIFQIRGQKDQSTLDKNIIGTKRGKEEDKKYISSKISGSKGESKQEIKYFSKNIVIQPINIVTQRGETQTNIQQYQVDYNNRPGMKRASKDNKNLVQTIDILKGVQYINKNIVIEPVPKGKYEINKMQGQIGKREINKVYSRGKPFEINAKNEEDTFFGRLEGNEEIINEDVLRNIPGIDENTKLFHKQIIITPVIIPPPRFIQH